MKQRSVKIGNRIINIDEKGHVDVISDNPSKGSTKEKLRAIAKEIGYTFDEAKETTQSLGQKLVRFLKGKNGEVSEDIKNPGEEVEMKTLYVYVGGQEGHYLECISCDEDVLENLQSEDDSEDIKNQIDEQYNEKGEDFLLEWAILPFDEDYETGVRVTDSDDNEIFSDIITYHENLGNVKDWKFDESVSNSIIHLLTEKFKKLEEECEDEEELVGEAAYAVAKAHLKDRVKRAYELSGLKGDERLTLLAHFNNIDPFEYMFTVRIPVTEEFDINKLSLFCLDYDGYAPQYCHDSVAPFIKYGNVIYKGTADSGLESDWDNYYGFAILSGITSDDIEFEGGDF